LAQQSPHSPSETFAGYPLHTSPVHRSLSRCDHAGREARTTSGATRLLYGRNAHGRRPERCWWRNCVSAHR